MKPMFKIQAKPTVTYSGIRGLEKRSGSVRCIAIRDTSVITKLILKRDCTVIPLNPGSLGLIEQTIKSSKLFTETSGKPVIEAATKAFKQANLARGQKGKPVVAKADSNRKGSSSRDVPTDKKADKKSTK